MGEGSNDITKAIFVAAAATVGVAATMVILKNVFGYQLGAQASANYGSSGNTLPQVYGRAYPVSFVQPDFNYNNIKGIHTSSTMFGTMRGARVRSI